MPTDEVGRRAQGHTVGPGAGGLAPAPGSAPDIQLALHLLLQPGPEGPPWCVPEAEGDPSPGPWGLGTGGIHLSPFFFFFLFPSVPLFPFLSLHLWMYIWRQKLCADAQRRETQPLSPDTSQLHWGRGYVGTDLKRRMQAGGALGGRRGGRRAGGAAVLERSWVLQSGTLSEESYPHTGAGPSRVSGASPALPDFP